MQASHVLLGRPWQYDRKVTHDGYRNIYKFVMNNRTVKLASLSPLEASLDRAKLVEEFKRRSNRETNIESRVTNTRMSAFATKSEIKKTCVSTNRVHSTLTRVSVSLLQVNE